MPHLGVGGGPQGSLLGGVCVASVGLVGGPVHQVSTVNQADTIQIPVNGLGLVFKTD